MNMFENSHELTLNDDSHIAVIGGGPTGSFFSIFALKMAKLIGKDIGITIFEPRDFSRDGPGGCNRCGGIISELLVQNLAIEGINLPDTVVRRGIHSYNLHTECGSVSIETPSQGKTIATVYRGGGPKGTNIKMESFDHFLLQHAIREGAILSPLRIDRIEYGSRKPILFSKEGRVMEADLVVGAVGVNSPSTKIFEDIGFGYKKPKTVTTAIAELVFDEHTVSRYFGNSIHLFLLPAKNIKFAAMIPKGTYVTVVILGKDTNVTTVKNFMEIPVVKKLLPEGTQSTPVCVCLPKMNVKAPEVPFDDRIVICGDSGSTRLFKDGIGAAYYMGKAAAKTSVFEGVSKQHFQENYYKAYRSLITDNHYGKYLYLFTDLYRKNKMMTKGMLKVVQKEQKDPHSRKPLSSILWDMFTGNERYKKIFFRAMNMKMHLNLWSEFARNIR